MVQIMETLETIISVLDFHTMKKLHQDQCFQRAPFEHRAPFTRQLTKLLKTRDLLEILIISQRKRQNF